MSVTFDNYLTESTVAMFMQEGDGGFRVVFDPLNLKLETYASKYPELKKAGIDLNRLRKELAFLGGQTDAGTGRKILRVYNIICEYCSKLSSWITVVGAGVVGIAAGVSTAGMGAPAGMVAGAAVGAAVSGILYGILLHLVNALWRWAFVYGEYALTEGELNKMINSTNKLKARCIKNKDKAGAAKCDKIIAKAEAAIESLKMHDDDDFDED